MQLNREFIREVGFPQWITRTCLRQFSKRVLRRDNTIVLPTGLKMRLPANSHFASEVFITKCNVDWGSEALLAKTIDSQGVFLDIGANVGYYSLYMLPRVAAVHAFEPDPRALIALRKNLSPFPNAHVHSIAIGNKIGTVHFAHGQSSELSHVAQGQDAASHPVSMTTIDQFVFDNNLSVSAIKIDVEGLDMEVIEGALQTIREQNPIVLTESEPSKRLFDLIELLNYDVFAYIKSMNSKVYKLTEIKANTAYHTKMLFLTPQTISADFRTATSIAT